jgi:transaldolase
LLEQLRRIPVAVPDTGDIQSIRKLTPGDTTTNPSLITAAAQMPEYAEVVRGALEC